MPLTAAIRPTNISRHLGVQFFARRITLSAVEGARQPPLDNRTLPEYFSSEILSRRAERPALICSQERPRAHGGPLPSGKGVEGHLAWDFNEFGNHINALARGLVGLGVKKGDRVGVIMGNTRWARSRDRRGIMLNFLPSAYAMLQWACAKTGAILVTVNPAYRIRELVGIWPLCSLHLTHTFVLRLRRLVLRASAIFSWYRKFVHPPTSRFLPKHSPRCGSSLPGIFRKRPSPTLNMSLL